MTRPGPVYNAMHDRRPAAIVRCTDAADVIAAIRYSREESLDLAVRGGSHSVPGFGTCDGGLVVEDVGHTQRPRGPGKADGPGGWGSDLGRLRPCRPRLRAGHHRRIISTTGVAGLTMGGGIGHLTRGSGLSIDNLLGADVVTAEGKLVTASDFQNEDLFWALRGGGGNFGVVTSMEFQLHQVDTITGGPLFYEVDDAAAVMQFYREYVDQAPEELGMFFAWQIAPPLPFIPEDRVGDLFCAMVVCWTGAPEEADAVLKPFYDVAPVKASYVGPMPYPALNSAFDGLVPYGLQHYWKADFVTELTDEAIAAHVNHGKLTPVVNSTMHLYPINGAVHRVGSDETAFGHRDKDFTAVIAGMWPDPADNITNTAWVKEYYEASHRLLRT